MDVFFLYTYIQGGTNLAGSAHSWSVKVEAPSEAWDISSSSKQVLFGPRPKKKRIKVWPNLDQIES